MRQYIKKLRSREAGLNRNWGTIWTPLQMVAKAIGDRTGLVIGDWFRLIGTMEYLKEWELEYNREHFNVSRYADIRSFMGLIVKAGLIR